MMFDVLEKKMTSSLCQGHPMKTQQMAEFWLDLWLHIKFTGGGIDFEMF